MLKRLLDWMRKPVFVKVGLQVATMGMGMAVGYLVHDRLRSSPPVQQPETDTHVLQQQEVPQRYERKIIPGTALARLKERYETRMASRLMAKDLEDPAELPFWFRSYLRDQHPELPKQGKYQYPLVAEQILDWMVEHPDLKVPASADKPVIPVRAAASRVARDGNINLSGLAEVNSESTIAVDYNHPQFVMAASNHPSGTWRQKQFWSVDGGATWNKTELPLAPGTAFHSDPSLAFTSTGDAWAATLGIDSARSVIQVQLYKSVDHGATWTYNITVSEGISNDKEMIWIDNDPHSPNKDHIYVVWDVLGGGMRARISPDGGNTWGNIITLSNDRGIGAHVISGPAGEVYVAWPDVDSHELRLRKLNRDATSFGPVKVIAKTNSSYEIAIPSFCARKAFIYLVLGLDRSNGPRRGHLYAIWTDLNAKIDDPGCDGRGSDANTNIYMSSSADGGDTWSAPKSILAQAKTDQFNSWLDVDPTDGSVHVIYYSTRNDPDRKKTDIYYANSADGGTTWVNETKVTAMMTDETDAASNRNQYGDYNGLAVFQSFAHPVWTDRRTGTPGGKEQIYTSGIKQH